MSKISKRVNNFRLKIQLLHYDYQNPSSDFANELYYKTHCKKYNQVCLTNGINKQFMPGGGGTNNAITQIDRNCWNIENVRLVHQFSKNNLPINNEIHYKRQKIKNEEIIEQYGQLSAGSVLFGNIEHDKVVGVYHINGLNFNFNPIFLSEKKRREEYSKIAEIYYTKILEDFDNYGYDLIHLSHIPGFFYGGGDETRLGLAHALINFVGNCKELDKNIKLIVGDKKTFKLVYKCLEKYKST